MTSEMRTTPLTRRRFLHLAGLGAGALAVGLPRHTAQAALSLRVLLPPRSLPDAVLDSLDAFGVPAPIPTIARNDQEILDGLESSDYDLVVTPYYLTARAIARGLGQRMQPGMLPTALNLPPEFSPGKRMQDPANAFSMPAASGALGLIYDPAVMSAPGSWRDLISRAADVVLPSDFEIVISSLLRAYPNLTELQSDLRRLRRTASESHDPVGQVLRGRAGLTIGGDGQVRDTTLSFTIPSEGSYVWGLDYMVPAQSTAGGMAQAFVNAALQTTPPDLPPRFVDQPQFITPRVPISNSERERWRAAWERAR